MLKFSDLAARVAEKLFLKQQEVEDFLTLIVDVIEKSLYEDKQVKIKGLGTFKMTAVSARESVDVNTGERILIDSREKISFVPDVSMRDWVNKPFAQFETVLVSNGVDFDEVDERYRDEEDEETESETVSFLEPVSDIAQETVAIDNTTEEAAEAAAVETTNVTAEIAEAVSETTDIAEEILEKDSQEDATDSPQPQTIDFVQEEFPEPQTIDFVQKEIANEIQEEDMPVINDVVQEEEEILPVADFVQEETPEIAGDVQEEDLSATVAPAQETTEPVQKTEAPVQETTEPVQKEEPLIVKVVQEEPETTENPEEKAENKNHDDDLFDKYGYYVGPYGGQSTLRRLLKSKKTPKILIFILFIAMTAMMGFLYSEIKERDNRIDQFIEELKKATTNDENNAIEEEATEESLDAEEEDATETADSKDKNEKDNTNQNAENEQKKADKQEQKTAEKQAQRTNNDLHNAEMSQEDEGGSSAIEAYNRDPLVQAGNYQIIGIAQTMIVRDGQSFTGISKAFLGPNMEDYLSVVNGGIRSVRPGQKLKIPFLKTKKNRASK